MWPIQASLVFIDQPTALAALVAAYGDDGTGNPAIDPTQVCIDYIGSLYKPTGATSIVTNADGSTSTVAVMASDGKFNVNIAAQAPLPTNLSSYVITPQMLKRVFAPDFTPLPANLPAVQYEVDANGNLILDANGNPIPVTPS
jgi:hypothetical protein